MSTRTEEGTQVKRVNQVSFLNTKQTLEVNKMGADFDLHSAGEIEDNISQMIVVRDQNSTL